MAKQDLLIADIQKVKKYIRKDPYVKFLYSQIKTMVKHDNKRAMTILYNTIQADTRMKAFYNTHL